MNLSPLSHFVRGQEGLPIDVANSLSTVWQVWIYNKIMYGILKARILNLGIMGEPQEALNSLK